MSDLQHGFMPHRSCKSQLLSVLNKWTSILVESTGDSVDVFYLDFSKAFDPLPHLRPTTIGLRRRVAQSTPVVEGIFE